MSDVGTLEWARRTGGRMSTRDRFAAARTAALEQLAMLPRPWRTSLPVDPRVALPREVPATEVARAARERVEEVSPPSLVSHCMRTWLFGELAAACEGIDHDRELLYVSCMLHDLGLTDAHNGADPRAHCFAVEGAFATEDFLSARGWPTERVEAAAEAVALHVNVKVPPGEHGAEAHLLNVGAGVDVAGRGLRRLPRRQVGEVIARHPRDGFGEEFIRLLAEQATARPEARLAFFWRLGFRRWIERNPLDAAGESAPPATKEVSRTS